MPEQSMDLALNARTMLVLGVQRQDAAHFGRSAPAPCSVLALNARQMLPPGCDFSSTIFDFDHEPNKTQNNNKIKLKLDI